jgi:hypothetical protein
VTNSAESVIEDLRHVSCSERVLVLVGIRVRSDLLFANGAHDVTSLTESLSAYLHNNWDRWPIKSDTIS